MFKIKMCIEHHSTAAVLGGLGPTTTVYICNSQNLINGLYSELAVKIPFPFVKIPPYILIILCKNSCAHHF